MDEEFDEWPEENHTCFKVHSLLETTDTKLAIKLVFFFSGLNDWRAQISIGTRIHKELPDVDFCLNPTSKITEAVYQAVLDPTGEPHSVAKTYTAKDISKEDKKVKIKFDDKLPAGHGVFKIRFCGAFSDPEAEDFNKTPLTRTTYQPGNYWLVEGKNQLSHPIFPIPMINNQLANMCHYTLGIFYRHDSALPDQNLNFHGLSNGVPMIQKHELDPSCLGFCWQVGELVPLTDFGFVFGQVEEVLSPFSSKLSVYIPCSDQNSQDDFKIELYFIETILTFYEEFFDKKVRYTSLFFKPDDALVSTFTNWGLVTLPRYLVIGTFTRCTAWLKFNLFAALARSLSRRFWCSIHLKKKHDWFLQYD